MLCQIYQISSGAIQTGLDGDSAMKESLGAHPLNPAQPSFDLLADIRSKISRLPLKLSFFWVKGHKYKRHGFVSYLGTLNGICDSLANQHWNDSIPLGTRPAQRFGDEKFSVSIDGDKLSQLNKTEFYDASYGRTRSIPYWQEHQHLNDEEIQAINWPALALAPWPTGRLENADGSQKLFPVSLLLAEFCAATTNWPMIGALAVTTRTKTVSMY
jgi:hypothetical protein